MTYNTHSKALKRTNFQLKGSFQSLFKEIFVTLLPQLAVKAPIKTFKTWLNERVSL